MVKRSRKEQNKNEITEIRKELKEIKNLLANLPLSKDNLGKKGLETPFLITFTDLIYGVVIAMGLSFIPSLLNSQKILCLILLGFAFILIFDDWYGEHFYGSKPILGNLWIYGDIAAFFIFFFYEYLSMKCSFFLLLAMSINGIRGIILDYIYFRRFPKESIEHSLVSISLKYAITFTGVYLLFFLIGLFGFQIHHFSTALILSTIGLWVLLRVIEDIAKRRIIRESMN